MPWDVLYVGEFEVWLNQQDRILRSTILAHIELLKTRGPQLGRPHVDTLKGSIHSNMKELRVTCQGEPWRILFAFDPARNAVMLVGGNKAGDKRFYLDAIRLADDRFSRYLQGLKE